MRKAGAVRLCAVHPASVKPCAICERDWNAAIRQKAKQDRDERAAEHERWLSENDFFSVQRARRQQREQSGRPEQS